MSTSNNFLFQPVTSVPGIGLQTAKRFEKLGIRQLQDLLFHLPHRYEDRTQLVPIGSLQAGMSALICGTVDYAELLPRGRRSLVAGISDSTGEIALRFFHFNANLHHSLKTGTLISCFAEVRNGYAGLEMIHPEYRIVSDPSKALTENSLTPVYPSTEGLNQSSLRKAVRHVLAYCFKHPELLIEWLPAPVLKQQNFPTLMEAIRTLHAPEASTSGEALQNDSIPALKRLAFEELLAHYLSLKTSKHRNAAWQAPVFSTEQSQTDVFIGSLPFTLTHAQRRVMAEIAGDCQQHSPMMRLVQGDVGSGKTVVAAYAALLAVNAGYQVAIMAPTELLAEQHFRNFNTWFDALQQRILLFTGQVKGRQRQDVLQAIADGSAGILIGTHALFQEGVVFHRLGLCIIDEQHRFGVHQRLALREKGKETGIKPHQLVMTATPIPRTLAMLQYSDLDISVIDELPPNRKPVVTSVIPSERRDEVIARISSWVGKKRQAYWVCTLIDESDVLQCEAAEQTARRLQEALPEVSIELIHGRMKTVDKEAVMSSFKNHTTDLLVATTVIEVGVDVPNAGLMIIENPERLGLSQLHQLRGRVGRGDSESFCLLLYQSPLSDTARQRLGILRDSNDGFLIAEKDLQLRGPGDVIGTRQTGAMQFKVADLSRDVDLLDSVQAAGDRLFAESPEAIQPLCDRWLGGSTEYAEV